MLTPGRYFRRVGNIQNPSAPLFRGERDRPGPGEPWNIPAKEENMNLIHTTEIRSIIELQALDKHNPEHHRGPPDKAWNNESICEGEIKDIRAAGQG